MFTATQFVEVRAMTQDQAAFDEAYRTWQHTKAVITALLDAYFRDPAVNVAWMRCRAVTTAYYVQIGIFDEDRRKTYLNKVAAGLEQVPPEDWSEDALPRANVPKASRDLTKTDALRAATQEELRNAVGAVVDARMKI